MFVFNLTGGVGGLMGLFLGVSIISITELLEFMLKLCAARLSSQRQRTIVEPISGVTAN